MIKLRHILCVTVGFIGAVLSAVYINDVSCYYNEKFVSSCECPTAPCGKLICVTATTVFTTPLNNCTIVLQLVRKDNATSERRLLTHVQNLCHVTEVRNYNYFGTSLMKLMSKYWRHVKCPLYGSITMRKLPLMMHFAEGFYTAGDYELSLNLKTAQFNVSSMYVSFKIG